MKKKLFAALLALVMLLALFPVSALADEETTTPALTGQGTPEAPYELAELADLYEVYRCVAGGYSFAGQYLLMTADIQLDDAWQPIGVLREGATSTGRGANILSFQGTFDGGNHRLTIAQGGYPLFEYVFHAAIRNLNVYGEQINGSALVNNYTVDYGPTGKYNSDIAVCDIENVMLLSGSSTLKSGLVNGNGSGGNAVNFTNCTIQRDVTIGYTGGESGIGSLISCLNGKVTGCASYATVKGVDRVGGLVGSKGQSAGSCSITDSSFQGAVQASGNYAGGLIAAGYDGKGTAPNTPAVSIQNCFVSGTVSGADYVGGLMGGEIDLVQCWSNGVGTIRDNLFYGTISAAEGAGYVGGIVGDIHSLNRFNVVENNYYLSGCGADKGIGGAKYVDTSAVKSGWTEDEKTVYFDTSAQTLDEIRALLNETGYFRSVAKTDHNRSDDPLGADADALSRGMSAQEMADGTVLALLNGSWVQGERHPVLGSGLAVTTMLVGGSYKTEYVLGDELDLTGMKLLLTWSDGSRTEVPASEGRIIGYDNTLLGTQTVTIEYASAQATFQVSLSPVLVGGISVYVTIAVGGSPVMAMERVTVSDTNHNGYYDISDVLYAAHEAGYEGGAAAGYADSYSPYGLNIDMLWGDTSGCFGYWLNNASCWSLSDKVQADDCVVAFVYQDMLFWSDAYTAFVESHYEVQEGSAATVSLIKAGYDENWNTVLAPFAGAKIRVTDAEGKDVAAEITDNGDGSYALTLPAGVYTLTATSDTELTVPAVCTLTVTAKPVVPSTPQTGDESHTALYAVTATLSAAALLLLLGGRKRRYADK